MNVRDKIVLVTGGANGIGKALCERFHADGAAKIYVADLDFENAEIVAESVGGKSLKLDVADEANCKSVVKNILEEAGRLDFIASNAGIGGAEGSLEVSNEIWQKIYEVNVLSHVYLARAAFPSMIENGSGAFLITASAAGLLTHPTAAPYSVTKHAAVALAENLVIEFGGKGIYVSCLCPQGVKTNLIASAEGEPENFLMAEAITAEECATAVVKALEKENFLILPHAEVADYIVNKAENYDRWLYSLRKIRTAVLDGKEKYLNGRKKYYDDTFDKLKVGNLELANRIVYAPMTRSRASDEGVQPDYVEQYYTQRATAGLLITEATNVSLMAKGYSRTPGIFTDEQIESWRKVTDAVHAAGGKIFMQIFHTGRIALPDFLPENQLPVAPSTVKAKGQNYTDSGMKEFVEPRELTTEEVKETIRDFGKAAKNAIAAGFDGVELHGASGYLVQQFLMKPVNQRTDEYGGSIENRARFLFEVLDAMSNEIGSERVGVKFSPQMPFNDVQEPDADEIYKYIFEQLNDKNLAYVHVGDHANLGWHEKLRSIYKGVYFAGANFDKERGAKYLSEDKADAIVYGKLFLANPDLPKRFKSGAELNDWDEATFYTPGEKGYTDYPTLEEAEAAK